MIVYSLDLRFFVFKQKSAYGMRISDLNSDGCSSDLLRSLDDERDYTSYRGALRGFYRMSPLINLYVQGYVNRRDFRQAADDAGVNRDASTIGGTVGAEFDPVYWRDNSTVAAVSMVFSMPAGKIGRAHVCTPVTNAHIV